MEYTVENGKITVFAPEDFDILKTLECGQVFRYKKTGENFEIFTENKHAILKNEKNNVIILTSDEKYFVKYFDLCQNYDIIRLNLKDKGLFDAAMTFGKGIRILQQSPFETIISFIISANNHIPRIKKIIETLCTKLGEPLDGYYAFPSVEALATQSVEFFEKCGLGYRANYVFETARAIYDGFDINSIYDMPSDLAQKTLCKLKGVGPKVADCVLLFGFGKTDVFPVDTWISKVYNCYFGQEDNPKIIRKALVDKFDNLSGYAQQYLFYYKRELDKKR
ncbi:MAG: DNA glycosylase [Clostridia bacterium]